MLLIVLCSSTMGVYIASGLTKKVSAIENTMVLLNHTYDRMRYLQPPLADLIASATGLEQLRDCAYLAQCRDGMRVGTPFPICWRTAVEQSGGELGKEEVALLCSLADVLGATDLDSQLTAIAFVRREMEKRLELARQYRDKHYKLYSTLGVLTGFAIIIILV